MSAELDFLHALSESSRRRHAAPAFLAKLADGGRISRMIAEHPQAASAAIGGLLAAGAQYMALRRRGDRPSIEQASAERRMVTTKAREAQAKKEKRPLGFGEEVSGSIARTEKSLADIGAKHPGKTSLLAAPAGALTGALIAKAFKR